jgi:2-phosphoglycerate kinase
MKKALLIGGAPTLGKSHTARRIANELDFPWISTDTIRDQMRKLVRREDYPDLFIFYGLTTETAIDYLTKSPPEQIVEDQNKESAEVWKGVKALIETDKNWETAVIEGVALLPELVFKFSSDKKIIPIFLIDDNKERIKETIFSRGLWDDAGKYPDSVKEKEVEWVLVFNNWIKRKAKKYKLKIVDVGDRSKYLDEIKSIVR